MAACGPPLDLVWILASVVQLHILGSSHLAIAAVKAYASFSVLAGRLGGCSFLQVPVFCLDHYVFFPEQDQSAELQLKLVIIIVGSFVRTV